ncbi:MAG: hypothetical protein KGL39_59600, partial [Patescibacteria group bacterium]|nr:hypothetical protein [Patescibacteria group bacterium]
MKLIDRYRNVSGQTGTTAVLLPVKVLTALFVGILSLFFGMVYSAQILALLGIYRLWIALPFAILIAAGAGIVYFRSGPGPAEFFPPQTGEQSIPRWVELGLYAAGGLLILALVAIPVAAWPYSPINQVLHWDAGAYHFPKAVELFKSGNVWDLSIPYGEYPFG